MYPIVTMQRKISKTELEIIKID